MGVFAGYGLVMFPYAEPRQFRGLAGYAGFVRLRIYQLRFIRQAGGQVRIAAGHEPGQPELLVPEKCFEEWRVGNYRDLLRGSHCHP